MRRAAIAISVLLWCAGCRKDAPATVAPINLVEGEIVDDPAKVRVAIGYRPAPEREIELVVDLAAIGIEEMDKIVVDIVVEGFALVGGEAEWSGFVAPRFPIVHRASFRLLEGTEAGTLAVTVQRSVNSEVLFERTLAFTAEGDRVRPDD
ncbi:MAG: hypothetical protein IAG13_26635 [Deltaproteobacteria bacterium]|nr:hypothetical protein [Nannocystaceae bacterium]